MDLNGDAIFKKLMLLMEPKIIPQNLLQEHVESKTILQRWLQ